MSTLRRKIAHKAYGILLMISYSQQSTPEGKEEEEVHTETICEEEAPERSEIPTEPKKLEDLSSAEVKRSVELFKIPDCFVTQVYHNILNNHSINR